MVNLLENTCLFKHPAVTEKGFWFQWVFEAFFTVKNDAIRVMGVNENSKQCAETCYKAPSSRGELQMVREVIIICRFVTTSNPFHSHIILTFVNILIIFTLTSLKCCSTALLVVPTSTGFLLNQAICPTLTRLKLKSPVQATTFIVPQNTNLDETLKSRIHLSGSRNVVKFHCHKIDSFLLLKEMLCAKCVLWT